MDIEQAPTTRTFPTPSTRCLTADASPLPSAPAVLMAHARHSIGRAPVEDFIRNEFFVHFGATITSFMPHLIALHEPTGEVRAAVGSRCAAAERLFLETYTREPIEQILADRLGCTVAREQIVEVGSLACRNGRAAIEIVKAVIPVLIHAGFTWVVFTGADSVRNVFRRLHLEPHSLCHADRALLGDAQDQWGTYYDHHPIVMAGRLVDGIRTLALPGVQ